MAPVIRVLVVDDTLTYRMILKRVAETFSGVQVVATATNGKIALAKIIATSPDVVLLDVEMPEMDGLSTLRHITADHPNIHVIMVSGLSRSNANIVMKSLSSGALDFITKPQEKNAALAIRSLQESLAPLFEWIKLEQSQQKLKKQRPPRPSTLPRSTTTLSTTTKAQPPACPELLLIGASTGGPAALTNLLKTIESPLPIPTLVVQHMPPVFTTSLADQLSRTTRQNVVEAQQNLTLEPEKTILARGGHHMVLTRNNGAFHVDISDAPKVNECRPSIDVLFDSVASVFKGSVLTVILTGMGRDGTNGLISLKQSNNRTYCITQEKKSCVVYGMPRSIDEKKLSDESLTPEEIGVKIQELCFN